MGQGGQVRRHEARVNAPIFHKSRYANRSLSFPSRPSLPSTSPERHTKSHCFLLRGSHAPLQLPRHHTCFHFLARERLHHPPTVLRPRPKLRSLLRHSLPHTNVAAEPAAIIKQKTRF